MIVLTIIVMIPLFFIVLLMFISCFHEVLTNHYVSHDECDHTEMTWLMLAIFAITWLIIGMMGWLICQF